jgi:hypothetical protein
LTVFLTSRKLLALDALPKAQKSNQDYFVQKVIPELQSERSRFARRKAQVELAAHGQFNVPQWHENDKRFGQSKPYPAAHPCNFWVLGMSKHQMRDRQLQSQEKNCVCLKDYGMKLLLTTYKMFSWPGWSECNTSSKTAESTL